MKPHQPITTGIAILFFVALIAGSSGGHAAAAARPPLEPAVRATRNRNAIPLVIGRWVFMSPPGFAEYVFLPDVSAMDARKRHPRPGTGRTPSR